MWSAARRGLLICALVSGAGVSSAAMSLPASGAGGVRAAARPQVTPVLVAPLSAAAAVPVLGTDARLHVLYELQLTNTRSAATTVRSVEVRGVDPRVSIVTFADAELVSRLRRLDGQPVPNAVVEPSAQRLLVVDVSFGAGDALPVALTHRVTLDPTSSSGPAPEYSIARVELAGVLGITPDQPLSPVAPVTPITLGPPVLGSNWVITDGCCGPASPHRSTVLPTALGLSVPERFGVDFRQMDDTGRFVQGDPAVVDGYVGYGVDVLAVASGRVVEVVDGFPEQVPGATPLAGTFAIDGREGNTIVLELGNGAFVFYGQLQAGSIIVGPGDRVRRGQPIARLGNSGDGGVGPHLHFHVMDGPAMAGSDGLAFVLNRFSYAGQIESARIAALGLAGDYADSRFAVPMPRAQQLPLDLAVLDFGASPGNSGNPLA